MKEFLNFLNQSSLTEEQKESVFKYTQLLGLGMIFESNLVETIERLGMDDVLVRLDSGSRLFYHYQAKGDEDRAFKIHRLMQRLFGINQ